MGRFSWIVVAGALPALAGCLETTSSVDPARPPASVMAELPPAPVLPAEEAAPAVPQPPPPPRQLTAGPASPTVQACRDAVAAQASKYGAEEVEAVPNGPQKRLRVGGSYAPVRVRVTYRGPGGPEVRESSLVCVTDDTGRLVDVYAPAEGDGGPLPAGPDQGAVVTR